MQDQSIIAKNLLKLFDPNAYKEFREGYFVNQPKMFGYYYLFKNMKEPKICVIINTSGIKHERPVTKTDEFVFVVYNVLTLEDFVGNLADQYLSHFLESAYEYMKGRTSRDLPYGYYYDESHNLKVDNRQADTVRKIYDVYINTKSIREVSDFMKTNFSDIREILHDYGRYAQMRPTIVQLSKIREVASILASNVRGGAVAKQSLEGELKEVRRRRKEREKAMEEN